MAAVLAVGLIGTACLAVALAEQRHPSEPPLTGTSHSTGDVPGATAQAVAVPAMRVSRPTSITIPAIHVRSALQSLGLNSDGTVQVPAPGAHYNEAGWYRYSPTPGALGPAVILGHIDSARQGPSIFFKLGELKAKDTIAITRADGTVATFAVEDVRRYPKTAFPTNLVYGNTTDAALRLVSCGGSFDDATGHYRDNIIVFATLIAHS